MKKTRNRPAARFSHVTAITMAVSLAAVGCESTATSPDSMHPNRLETAFAPAQPATPLPFWLRSVWEVDDWAVVIFYAADPTDVPDDFNLIDFFDLRAVGVPQSVAGVAVWDDLTTDPAPRVVQLKGLGAVPMWFLPQDLFLAEISDGVLTMGELRSLESLRGRAHSYHEVLMPSQGPAKSPRLDITARGTLDGGGAFRMRWSCACSGRGARTTKGFVKVQP